MIQDPFSIGLFGDEEQPNTSEKRGGGIDKTHVLNQERSGEDQCG